jgi:hypothetical protein
MGAGLPRNLTCRRGLASGQANHEEIAVESFQAIPWGFVLIGGPVLLGAALLFAKMRNARRNRAVDPETPSDDPAKGMTGHH